MLNSEGHLASTECYIYIRAIDSDFVRDHSRFQTAPVLSDCPIAFDEFFFFFSFIIFFVCLFDLDICGTEHYGSMEFVTEVD